MDIGFIIRKYRKEKNLTQEEMANYLGVTAPAVNKWENGNSFPDITLLAPIARLLGISLDTLLTFKEEPSEEEINQMIIKLDSMIKTEGFEAAYQWGKKQAELYPNCDRLLVQTALVLDAQRLFQKFTLPDNFEEYILGLYAKALKSEDECVKLQAADALVWYYIRKEQYDKAEEYLVYFSMQNPERKSRQAHIYYLKKQDEEAYKCYEEILFSEYQRAVASLQGMYLLAVRNDDMQKAHRFADKQSELARIFEMGKYHETACQLELAVMEKDENRTTEIVKAMLDSFQEIASFRNSSLYEHMEMKEASPEFYTQLRENLLKSFSDEETFGYMANNAEWKNLLSVGSE